MTLETAGEARELYGSWDDSYWSAHATVLSAVSSSRSVLDVGCATGNLGVRIMALGGTVVGVEPNENAARLARSRGVEVIIGTFDRFTLDALGPRRFATIVFADTLEHMVDPFAALLLARGLLETDGRLIVSIPNIVVWHARALVALGHFDYRPGGIFDRTHLRFFTSKTARRLVESCGFRVESVSATRVVLPVGPKWLRSVWDQAYGRLAPHAPSLLAEQFVMVAAPTHRPVIGEWP